MHRLTLVGINKFSSAKVGVLLLHIPFLPFLTWLQAQHSATPTPAVFRTKWTCAQDEARTQKLPAILLFRPTQDARPRTPKGDCVHVALFSNCWAKTHIATFGDEEFLSENVALHVLMNAVLDKEAFGEHFSLEVEINRACHKSKSEDSVVFDESGDAVGFVLSHRSDMWSKFVKRTY